ncbi:hypothetical protein ACNUDN_27780 [Mycobacterium sp. smrl_JER01]
MATVDNLRLMTSVGRDYAVDRNFEGTLLSVDDVDRHLVDV